MARDAIGSELICQFFFYLQFFYLPYFGVSAELLAFFIVSL